MCKERKVVYCSVIIAEKDVPNSVWRILFFISNIKSPPISPATTNNLEYNILCAHKVKVLCITSVIPISPHTTAVVTHLHRSRDTPPLR